MVFVPGDDDELLVRDILQVCGVLLPAGVEEDGPCGMITFCLQPFLFQGTNPILDLTFELLLLELEFEFHVFHLDPRIVDRVFGVGQFFLSNKAVLKLLLNVFKLFFNPL